MRTDISRINGIVKRAVFNTCFLLSVYRMDRCFGDCFATYQLYLRECENTRLFRHVLLFSCGNARSNCILRDDVIGW